MKVHRVLFVSAGVLSVLSILSIDFSIRFYEYLGGNEHDRDLVEMIGFALALIFVILASAAVVGGIVVFRRRSKN